MARKPLGQLRCVSYLRCSTDDQRHGDFTTIDTQRQLNTERVASLGGVHIGDYADEGRTGTNLKRPDWKRMLADAQAHLFDVVIVTYMSRLGRGNAFTIAEYELEKAGVRVEMVREQFTDDLIGYIGKNTTIMMDGLYPRMVSQWTKTKLEAMVAKGYRCGGTLPFGFTTESVSDPDFSKHDKEPPKRLIVHPDEAPFVVQAFNIFLETKSTEKVRQYLNGVTTRLWSLDSVALLLSNEVYRGVLIFGQWRNNSSHEPIIHDELWKAVQEQRALTVRSSKADPVDTASFYLRGLVHCSHCGVRMTPANHHGSTSKVRYYECTSNTKWKRVCPVKRVNALQLHAAVLDHIRRAALHPTRMAEIIREAVKIVPVSDSLDNELSAVNRRLKDVEKSTKSIMTAIESGGAGLRVLLTRLAELQSQQGKLQAEQYQIKVRMEEGKLSRPNAEAVQATWARFMEVWEKASEEDRNKLLPLLVERVDMTEKERGTCRLVFEPAYSALTSESHTSLCGINSELGSGGWT